MKGSYLLIIELKDDKKIKIGKLGNIFFKKGYYIYVGSALNGIEQRVKRHLRIKKKMHWHIDYFLQQSNIIRIYYKASNAKEECSIANFFTEKLSSIPKFGCSDCKCTSHLFYGKRNDIIKMVDKLNFIQY